MEYVQAILMLVVIVVGREAAHAFTGRALGYHPKLVAIGIPFEKKIGRVNLTTVLWRTKVGKVEYMLSALLLGGGVDFYDFEKPPFLKMTAIALAGPVFNLLAAFVVAVAYLGWSPAVDVSYGLGDSTLTAMGMVTSGEIPVLETARMGTMVIEVVNTGTSRHLGWLLNWMLLNVSLGLVNLFPLPALDGGQIIMSAIVTILGERFRLPAKNITGVFLVLLCSFLVVGISLDLWSLAW